MRYGDWRTDLSLLALGVAPDDVWSHPRRFRGKPFVDLIDFPDSVGPSIGAATATKLHADFVRFAAKARRHYLSPTRDGHSPHKTWMWETYRHFRRAFKLASDDGFVLFC